MSHSVLSLSLFSLLFPSSFPLFLGSQTTQKQKRKMATESATMAPPSISNNDLFNYIVIYDTISATPSTAAATPQYDSSFFFCPPPTAPPPPSPPPPPPAATKPARGGGGGSKKRRRKARVCKNKEEAETQRMTHIAVERNRRKLMNEHLALLRSLMPLSYVQRGDQASIVAGAIEFVKELEHSLNTLQAQKLQLTTTTTTTTTSTVHNENLQSHHGHMMNRATISCTSSSSSSYNEEAMNSNGSTSSGSSGYNNSNGNIADVEVTLVESHANLRILWRKEMKAAPLQLSKLVCGLHALGLGVLHFSLATVHPFALYSVSAKVKCYDRSSLMINYCTLLLLLLLLSCT
ncbi:unnamed protein product [Linum tenue]|uniref:BHLH domain-containing protein n=1 Tax=Linum tenue TaxID=586396 RepID=A0AAV0RJG7_9ROSI|nr:unnamed protein product [Linum tenue]